MDIKIANVMMPVTYNGSDTNKSINPPIDTFMSYMHKHAYIQ